MAIPNQPCGLTNFDKRLPLCPPNSNSIRSIVFTKDNLSVISGPNTETQISLKNFYVPVANTARTSFTIPARNPKVPYTIYQLDLAGLDLNNRVKFLAVLPMYGGTSSTTSLSTACGGTGATSGSTTEYVEWAFQDDINSGALYNLPVMGPSSSSWGATQSFQTSIVNSMEWSWGGYIGATAARGCMWIATDGGLIKYDGAQMKLWNTQNSNSASDKISSLAIDSTNIWVGSNCGISLFNETSGFINWNTLNSNLISNTINTLKIYHAGKLAIGTDKGLTLYDHMNTDGTGWSSFTIYNTPTLHHNNITALGTDSNFLFVGTTGGVYFYQHNLNIWDSPINSSYSGWSAPDEVTALEVYGIGTSAGGKLYIGTSNGLVIVPYEAGTTATTVLAGPSGPVSNIYKSLRIVEFGTGANTHHRLYASHDDGFSVYNIDTETWVLGATSSFNTYLGTGISSILPDYLSGITLSDTIFFGSESLGEGVARITYTGTTGAFSYVPESNKVTNLLLSLPLNPGVTHLAARVGTPGCWEQILENTNVFSRFLYPNNQNLHFVFSKDMAHGTASNFGNFVTLKEGLTGSGATVTGVWTWDSTGRIGTFTPSTTMKKAQGYNLTLSSGSTASDNSYVNAQFNVGFYTEDIAPIMGWKTMGKMLIHTGTEDNLTQGIYLRNPQNSEVNFTALIGR